MSNIIEVKNLKKIYEYYKKPVGFWPSLKGLFFRKKLFAEAVAGVSLTIKEGELVGFLGPNGAGKTTTLKMLSGILHPTSGDAKVLGHTPWKREKAYQRQFALVMGQKTQLWWDLPAVDTFEFIKEVYSLSPDEFKKSLDELVKLLNVKEIIEVPVRKLSLGERMKCELIAALLHKPKVIFLDEPTIGLDIIAQKNVRNFIKEYNRKHNTTIVLTSHYMEDIKELCERVVIINHGNIVYDGSLSKLSKCYGLHKTLKISFDKPVQRGELSSYGELLSFDPYLAEFQVDKAGVKELMSNLLSSSLPIDDIIIEDAAIEGVIAQIFGEKK